MNSINKLIRVLGAAMVAPPTMNQGKNNPPPGGFTCYMFAWFTGPGFGTIYLQNIPGPDGMPVNVPVPAYDADGNGQVNYPTTPPTIVGVPSDGRWRLISVGSNTPLDTVTGEPGSETIVPPSGTPEACREPPKPLEKITKNLMYLATICGEASTESVEGKSLVMAIANNRAQKKVNRLPASVVPSWVEDSPVVREFLTPLAFSCWNDRYPSNNAAVREAAGSNPRASRANFEKRLNYLLSLCGENPSMAGVSPAYGRRSLVERGMTEAQAKRTYLYLNPESANSQEGWATSTVDSANRHPFPAKFWKDTITGYRGAKTKAVLVRYNNHVFVSSPDLNP